MDGGQTVLDSLKFSAAWAIATIFLFFVLVLLPFEDWSTANKVALFQAFVVVAGFGAGLVLLAATVSQSFTRDLKDNDN